MNANRSHAVALPWLIRLRWWTLAAQGVAVLSATWTAQAESAPAIPVAVLLGAGLSNVLLAVAHRRGRHGAEVVGAEVVGPVLLLDTVALTAVLHLTGGVLNPFTVLYLVHITLAALVLGTRWVLPVTVLSLVGFGALFLSVRLGPHWAHMGGHLGGMWLAFGIAAALIAVFVSRMTAELTRREQELERARERADRHRRVAALTSLAAAAAHELGTPIGTIALAASELERALDGHDVPDEVRSDARLIRAEVRRCRALLDGLAASAGEPPSEHPRPVGLADLADRIREPLAAAERQRVETTLEPDDGVARVPVEALVLAARNLLRNALDASRPDEAIRLRLAVDGGALALTVQDDGVGMAPEVLARAGEPFFSTKGSGAGLGLGLFLVRALADQLGGRLGLESAPGRGTIAHLELPELEGAAE